MIFKNKVCEIYRSRIFIRCENKPYLNYFSVNDFEGMAATPYSFKNNRGEVLRGCFYDYPGCDKTRLVVFDHGLGSGHRSYMQEIVRLCKAGFYVFSYDHTGCVNSEGETTRGLSGSLADLDDCLKALKADPNINTEHISVVGHSWGGYSCMNIPAFHSDVEKSVVLAGFVSVPRMVGQNFPHVLSLYRKDVLALERGANPRHYLTDGVETIKKAATKYLLIYSDNDRMVDKKIHYDTLLSVADRDNVTLLLEKGKGHNPNYSYEAVKALAEVHSALKNPPKTEEEAATFKNARDWHKITEQDENIWKQIIAFLK